MKLSDLSYREYLAIEFTPQFAAKLDDNEAVWRAFGLADAFLKRAGKENDKIAQAEKRAKHSDISLQVFKDHIKHILSDPSADDADMVQALKHIMGLPV